MPDMKTNYHTHTTYCDGESSPREIAEEAARLGMSELGFSGHSYTSVDESYCMSRDGMRAYYGEVGALAAEYGSSASAIKTSSANDENARPADRRTEYSNKGLKILRGIEMDYFSDPEDYMFDWDFIICSCHYIKKNGEIFPVDESEEILRAACEKHYGGDIYSLIADYYTEVGNVADVVRAGCITAERSADAKLITGHFDLITKFNEGGTLFDESDPRYREAWMSALDRLTGRAGTSDLVFEINTGAMSRGYRTAPYPAKEVLIEIARRGVPVVLSSDSHEKSTLLYGFDEAAALAEECGAELLETL